MKNSQLCTVLKRGEESSLENGALLETARTGDQDALARLLAPYQHPLYLFCKRVLGDADEAADAVQETFARAIHALPQFRQDASVQTWLYRIALHLCLDRKRQIRRTTQLETVSEETIAFPSPEANALNRMQIAEALANLLPRQRAIFLLREWQGWSVTEIADVLNCTQRHVNNELYKVRRILEVWAQRELQERSKL